MNHTIQGSPDSASVISAYLLKSLKRSSCHSHPRHVEVPISRQTDRKMNDQLYCSYRPFVLNFIDRYLLQEDNNIHRWVLQEDNV